MNNTKLALAAATIANLQDLATFGMREHNGSLFFAMPVDIAKTVYNTVARELLDAGAGVKVLEGDCVYTVTKCKADTDALVWHKRVSRVTRNEWTTIQVQLA